MNWTCPKQIVTIQNYFGTKEGQGMRLEVNVSNYTYTVSIQRVALKRNIMLEFKNMNWVDRNLEHYICNRVGF